MFIPSNSSRQPRLCSGGSPGMRLLEAGGLWFGGAAGGKAGFRHRSAGRGSGGTSSFGFIKFRQLIEQVVGRQIDLVDYGGSKPRLDDDIRREAVLL